MSKTQRSEPAIARLSATLSIGLITLLTSTWTSAGEEPDYAAVQQRLDAAVIAGDMTQEQAQERWDAFLRRVELGEEHDPTQHPQQEHNPAAHISEHRGDRYARAERRMKAAVASGDMTEEQAAKRLARMKEHGATQREHETVARKRLKSIREAMAAGEMSQEDGEAAIRRVRERLAGGHDRPPRKDGDGVRGRLASIRQAVEAGEMTREEGEARTAAIHQRMQTAKRIEAEHQKARRAIREAIAAGEITREEGVAKLQEMRSAGSE
ncbi:MAG: hypothetical protein AAF525_00335 [Pseudomonadota bacterium]